LILQIAKQGCHALEISRRGLKAIATLRERLTHVSDDGRRAPRRSGSAANALDFVLAPLFGHGQRAQRHAQCARAGAGREGWPLCPWQRLRRHESMSRSHRQQAAPQPVHELGGVEQEIFQIYLCSKDVVILYSLSKTRTLEWQRYRGVDSVKGRAGAWWGRVPC